MEELKSLQDMIKILKKRAGLIVSLTVMAMLVSGAVTYFLIDPVYESTTQVLVSSSDLGEADLNNENLQTDLQLITTYSDIMKSPAILRKVKEGLGLQQSIGELNEDITVTRSSDSQVVNITVQAPNAADAVKISNTTAETVISEIPKLMDVENISVLSPAVLGDNQEPASPNLLLNMALAALAGLLIGISTAFLLEYVNGEIRDKQDVEMMLGIPVLGLIPLIARNEVDPNRLVKDEEG